jgi:IS4 transposase
LIHEARRLYAEDDFGLELNDTVYALDSSTIDLCLSLFPWARFRKAKAAVKLHTLLDLRGDIPTFIWITDGKVHDVNVLDHLLPEPGAIYVMDRAYLDFHRLYQMHQSAAGFVIRSKTNTGLRRLYSHKVDKSAGVKYDQTVVLTGFYARKDYPDKLRRIKFYDDEKERTFIFLTNQFTLPAATIAEIYRYRWRVEIFFKWIKQHLRIKKFYGTSENAVKTQIWIAISTYVLVAIMKKKLKIELTLYTILQILSISLFEKKPIYQVLTESDYKNKMTSGPIQLKLFEC